MINFLFDNVTTILRVVESTLIAVFMFRVLTLHDSFNFIEVLYEISITFASFVLTGRKSELTYNVLASSSLFYLCMPSFAAKFRYISLFYCFKIFQLRINLRDLASTVSHWKWLPNLKYFLFAYNFVRYTVLEFLFLGFSIAGYKIYASGDQEQLPEDYQLWYQLLVTSSTIGYGDVTPKSKNQMIYFTFAIPVVCGSFLVYLNHLNDAYCSTFITSQEKESDKTQEVTYQPIDVLKKVLEDSKVSKIQLGHLTQYAQERAKRVQIQKDLLKSLAAMGIQNDQVIQTSINLKRYDAMIKTMFSSTINDSLRRKIAQNIREFYVPKSGTIISKNEASSELMFVHEGTVRSSGDHEQKLKHTIFNDQGFYFGQVSEKNYTADTFCVIWAVDAKILRENFARCFPQKN